MNKNKIIISISIVVVFVFFLYMLLYTFLFQFSKKFNPPTGVKCFDMFMGVSDYPNNSEIPSFDISNISHFKCASWSNYYQYEINGIDKEGHSFYFYNGGGQTAASGVDSHPVTCYKKDGIIIKNDDVSFSGDYLAGGKWERKDGTCAWPQNDLGSRPDSSTYEYNSK